MNSTNPELLLAENFAQETDCTVFLTGKAGTGKTTFLKNLRRKTSKRLIITAPTGVAAINAGGVTLHSFFQIPFGPYVPGVEVTSNQHRFSREKKNIIRALDLLVIDEISMVRADTLDYVNQVLQYHRRSSQPFGGVQLLMIGDLHQLPPVVKDSEAQIISQHYETPYFFSSKALSQTDLISIELQHIYRQSDNHFIELLNRVRENKTDPHTLEQLNNRYTYQLPNDDEGYITLCSHNRNADAINQTRLSELQTKTLLFQAQVEGEFPENNFPASELLELKVGSQVMFVRNDPSQEKRYFNGKIGTITSVSTEHIEVLCEGENESIDVEKSQWENIEYSVNPETAEITSKIIGTFHQYPLRLAWAITIHKAQGLTFDKAIIDAEAAFAHGQVYVALSRCRSLEGLILSSPLTPSAIKTDVRIDRFLHQQKARCPDSHLLQLAQVRYEQKLILQCFNFQQLRRRLGYFVGMIAGNKHLIVISHQDSYQTLQEDINREICTVGDNFRNQLVSLFSENQLPSSDPTIEERLLKAYEYFNEKFTTHLSAISGVFTFDCDNKEIKRKISKSHKLLQEEITVKRAGIQVCQIPFSVTKYLRAISMASLDQPAQKHSKAVQEKGPIYYENDIIHQELYQKLKDWRKDKGKVEKVQLFQIMHTKTLVQLAVNLPDSLHELLTIKGIGPTLAERYGTELIQLITDYRNEHNIDEVELPDAKTQPATESPGTIKKKQKKGETQKITLELFQQGMSINDIIKTRELTAATIEKHLACCVERGELPIEKLVDESKRLAIEQQLQLTEETSMKAVKEALGEKYSYGEIHMVLAHLKSTVQ